ncbi:hypothetical protein M9458_052137 [Cirrhinus mrigala]|uniref:Uncharacterized protein n=1 Tax=Cirrhinus mrigala TaxID=683832 RepID=A0ABD0MQU5_CIRMR
MDDPALRLLLLEQGNRSLEDHTKDVVFLDPLTHYPDSSLCSFYRTGLNPTTRAQLSGDGPRESLAAYIEWVLVSSRPSRIVEDTSNTSWGTPQLAEPEPEPEPEPTADGEPEPRATGPSPLGVTVREIAMEPELIESDQVRELATEPATVDFPDGREGAEDSTAHCTSAEGEQRLDLGQLNTEVDLNFSKDIEMELPACPEPSVCPELSTCLNFPPTLISIKQPCCFSSATAPTICAVGSPRVCQSPSASGLEDPSSSPPALESWTPPRPSDPAAPPRLSAPSSPPSPISPPAPPGSLVPPAPPWSEGE